MRSEVIPRRTLHLGGKCAGNARTDPVVERVEAVEVFPSKEDMFTDTV